MRRNALINRPDMFLLCITLILVVCGVLLVLDTSYPTSGDQSRYGNDIWYFAKRQTAYAAVGLLLMVLVSHIPLHLIRRLSIALLLITIGLLVYVLVNGITINGSRSWGRLGPFLFQPSELAKLALIVYMARSLGRPGIFAKGRDKRWIAPLFWSGIVALLVVAERDFGTSVILFSIVLSMFTIAGAKRRYVALSAMVGFLAIFCAMNYLPHCRARVQAFRDPWTYYSHAGYQIVHSLIGFGTGGLTGVGLGQGRVKSYIPAAHTDYIYSTLAEECGLVGSLGLIVLFAVFVVRAFAIAGKSKSLYGALLSAGVASSVGTQALINMAVATNSIPATGLPLPFISYGGSSLVTTLIGVGLILSVSRNLEIEIPEEVVNESGFDRRRNGRTRLPSNSHSRGFARSRSERRVTVRR